MTYDELKAWSTKGKWWPTSLGVHDDEGVSVFKSDRTEANARLIAHQHETYDKMRDALKECLALCQMMADIDSDSRAGLAHRSAHDALAAADNVEEGK